MARLWAYVRWSLYWLWMGEWPRTDVDGVPIRGGSRGPLAGGYYGVLWTIKGDLEFYNQELSLPNFNSHQPCCLCRANTTDRPWTDFRQDQARWLETVWPQPAWLAAHPHRHPLFTLPG
eukprot:10845419-Alexandrium_andersonii.AAC.1